MLLLWGESIPIPLHMLFNTTNIQIIFYKIKYILYFFVEEVGLEPTRPLQALVPHTFGAKTLGLCYLHIIRLRRVVYSLYTFIKHVF